MAQGIRACQPDPALAFLHEAAADPAYQQLVRQIANGEKPTLPVSQPFKAVWDELSVGAGPSPLLLLGQRIVVPREARPKVLDLLHLPHTGMVKTYQHARQLYYWPTMKKEINDLHLVRDNFVRIF